MRDSASHRAAFRRAFQSKKRGHLNVNLRIGKQPVPFKAVLFALTHVTLPVPPKTVRDMVFHGFDVEVGITYAKAAHAVLITMS